MPNETLVPTMHTTTMDFGSEPIALDFCLSRDSHHGDRIAPTKYVRKTASARLQDGTTEMLVVVAARGAGKSYALSSLYSALARDPSSFVPIQICFNFWSRFDAGLEGSSRKDVSQALALRALFSYFVKHRHRVA